MLRIWLTAFLFMALALSGCTDAPDEGDDAGEGDDTGTGVGGGVGFGDDNMSGEGNVTIDNETGMVVLTDFPTEANATEAIFVEWEVDLENANASASANGSADDDDTAGGNASGDADTTNATGDEVEQTGLAYGFTMVAAPLGPEDYDEQVGVENNTTSGTFTADFAVDEAPEGSVFIRAYALVDGTYHWSEEVEIVVNGTAGEEHEVVIQDGAVAVQQFAEFDTTDLTIQIGDSVVWSNTASQSHSIVIEGPEEFETGTIASGEASEPIVFTTEGAYEFSFASGSSETGTITVEAAA